MNTGDLVTIGPLTGTVERMSIRSVGVRQDTGAYHIIPWSSITTFANFVRGIGSVVANYDVDRHEDADKAKQALRDAVNELMEMEDIRGLVIGEPSFAGIVGLTNTAFTLRVSFTTQPLKQWTVRFALDSMVKTLRSGERESAGADVSGIVAARFAARRSRRCKRAGWRLRLTRPEKRLFAAFVIVHKDRAIKRLCFWPCAISFNHFHRADVGQRAVKWRQVIATGDQRGKPFHLTTEALTLGNHAQNKCHFPALAPQLLLLAAKVQRAIFSCPVTPLAFTSRTSRGGGVVEWRVAQGGIILFVLMNNAVENSSGILLTTQTNGPA